MGRPTAYQYQTHISLASRPAGQLIAQLVAGVYTPVNDCYNPLRVLAFLTSFLFTSSSSYFRLVGVTTHMGARGFSACHYEYFVFSFNNQQCSVAPVLPPLTRVSPSLGPSVLGAFLDNPPSF